MDKLLEVLTELRPDIDFTAEEALIDDGILDSFDVVNIVSELSATFGVKITARHLKPENFNSAKAMWELIESLKQE
jgi:D-alanine--poly(phosphoribitol) ligase subunit 2